MVWIGRLFCPVIGVGLEQISSVRYPFTRGNRAGLKFIPQAGVDVMDPGVATAYFGVIVDLGVQVLFDSRSNVGPHHRKVSFGPVSLEVKGATLLAEVGTEAPAALRKFVLIEGVPLRH